MAEYIEREAVLKEVEPDSRPQLARRICEIPAADVVPVRHGRWIVSRTDYGWNSAEYPTHSKCSICGREIPYQDRDNYCPNCGARMDKDGDA